MGRPSALGIATALVVVTVLGGCLSAGTGKPTPGSENGIEGQTDIDPERVFLHVRIHANGSATWTVEYAYGLDTDERADAFEDLQADVRSNRSKYRSSFREKIGSSVERAKADTGREMAMGNVTVRTRRQQVGTDTGLVTYRFQWTNFSRTDGPEILVGDAIDGFFIDEKTRLEIAWPDEYELVSVEPSPPDERSATAAAWEGPTNFAADEPRLRLRAGPEANAASTATDGETVTATASPGGPATDASPVSPGEPAAAANGEPTPDAWLFPVAGVLAVLVGTIGGAYVLAGDDGQVAGEPDDGGDAADPDGEIPESLLSDRERVLATLRAEGGRMKQKALREELGWSAPKTSKVLGDLKDDDAVEVFRLGRENVVTLPDTGLEVDSNE